MSHHDHRHAHSKGPGHHAGDHAEGGDSHRDHLGNPEDMAAYLQRLEGSDRAEWQQPDAVVAALGLREGDRVCEIGAGPGYFTLPVARSVGPSGRVFAIDAEPRMLDVLRERITHAGLHNVDVILATDGAALPPEPVNRVLIVNTYHHFPDGAAYLRALATRLAPHGTIVNIDFHAGELAIGPPAGHKVSREDFIAAARSAGLVVVREEQFLPYQYFLVVAPG